MTVDIVKVTLFVQKNWAFVCNVSVILSLFDTFCHCFLIVLLNMCVFEEKMIDEMLVIKISLIYIKLWYGYFFMFVTKTQRNAFMHLLPAKQNTFFSILPNKRRHNTASDLAIETNYFLQIFANVSQCNRDAYFTSS